MGKQTSYPTGTRARFGLSIGEQVMAKFHPDARRAVSAGVNPVLAWRLQRGVTLQELARDTGLPARRIDAIQNDFNAARLSDIHRLAHALDVHPVLFAHEGKPMEDALLTHLLGIVAADNDAGRGYAMMAASGLQREAAAAASDMQAELARLQQAQHRLAYDVLRAVMAEEVAGPMTNDDIDAAVVRQRQKILRDKQAADARRTALGKKFDTLGMPVMDVAEFLTGSEEHLYNVCIPLWELWKDTYADTGGKRKRASEGQRRILEMAAQSPAMLGFEKWAGRKYLRLVGMQSWDEAYARFLGLMRQAYVVDELRRAETGEAAQMQAGMDYFDQWMDRPETRALMRRFANRQRIIQATPDLAEPMVKTHEIRVAGVQFRLAKGAAPR